MKRIGLVNLTPNQLELMSGLAQKPEVELVAAVHDDAEATSYKIAQVMEIPIGTGLDVLAQRHVDLVIAPEADAVRSELRRIGLDTEVLTTEEAAARFGVRFVDGLPDYSEGSMLFGDGLDAESSAAVPRPPVPLAHSRAEHESDGGGERAPNLEMMLRDALEVMLESEAGTESKLKQVIEGWTQLTGARACAIFIDDGERVGDRIWVAGGAEAELVEAPDALLRLALDGVPQIYVKHQTGDEQPRRALAAFPLEQVRGAVWFLDARLPSHGDEARLQALRRATRQLGYRVAIEGRLQTLERDRDAAVRFAEAAANITQATGREEVIEILVGALRAELRAQLIVLRLDDEAEPRRYETELSAAIKDGIGALHRAEEELAGNARSSQRTRQQPAMLVADQVVHGLASPLKRGDNLLGTISVFIAAPGAGETENERRQRLFERLALQAAGSLAHLKDDTKAETRPGAGTEAETVLDRLEFEALLQAEVRRSDRYQVPFLLTVIDLVWPLDAPAEPPPRFIEDFALELRGSMRDVDAVAHLRGWQFAILNPHTDRGGGRAVQRASQVLKRLASRYPGAQHVDVQGNQILYPGDVSSYEELAIRLDR
jgi:hypothetical protein